MPPPREPGAEPSDPACAECPGAGLGFCDAWVGATRTSEWEGGPAWGWRGVWAGGCGAAALSCSALDTPAPLGAGSPSMGARANAPDRRLGSEATPTTANAVHPGHPRRARVTLPSQNIKQDTLTKDASSGSQCLRRRRIEDNAPATLRMRQIASIGTPPSQDKAHPGCYR